MASKATQLNWKSLFGNLFDSTASFHSTVFLMPLYYQKGFCEFPFKLYTNKSIDIDKIDQ